MLPRPPSSTLFPYTTLFRSADVCVLVVDAKDGMHTQDIRIAETAWDKGTGLIVAVNKWDLIEEKESNTADRKSTRLNSSHLVISYAVFCLKKKIKSQTIQQN